MKTQARIILDVDEKASFQQIRNAWIRYMFRNHPDLNQDDEEATTKAMLGNECYSILIGKITKPSCLKIPRKEVEERIAFAQQYARQFGNGIWNY
jgi:DnaJ-class molecular chaperone